MGNYFDKKTCEICQDEGNGYENPLILIYRHIGKQNRRYFCWVCLCAKMNYEKLRKNNKYIVSD
jgi:hypothetical protein